MDKSYFMNKNFYNKMNKAYYKSDLGNKKRWILILPIVLPFHVHLLSRENFTHKIDGENNVTLIFDNISKSGEIIPGIESGKAPYEVAVSRVELVWISNNPIESTQESISYKYDVMIRILNAIIISITITQGLDTIHRITKEMLSPASVFTIYNSDWNEITSGLFMLNMEMPVTYYITDFKKRKRVFEATSAWLSGLNPIAASQEYIHYANYNFHKGFYREGVIFAQTSVESFVINVLKTLLDENGVPDEKIAEKANLSFKRIIVTEMSSLLGGSWDVTNIVTPVGNWFKSTYELRNRIVHAGYVPTFEESDVALTAAIHFMKFIVTKIRENKKKYPKMQSYIV